MSATLSFPRCGDRDTLLKAAPPPPTPPSPLPLSSLLSGCSPAPPSLY